MSFLCIPQQRLCPLPVPVPHRGAPSTETASWAGRGTDIPSICHTSSSLPAPDTHLLWKSENRLRRICSPSLSVPVRNTGVSPLH